MEVDLGRNVFELPDVRGIHMSRGRLVLYFIVRPQNSIGASRRLLSSSRRRLYISSVCGVFGDCSIITDVCELDWGYGGSLSLRGMAERNFRVVSATRLFGFDLGT